MSIWEMEKIKLKEEGRLEGEIKGKIEERNLILQVTKLLKQNVAIKDIAEQLNITQKEVREIKKQFEL